MVSIIRYYLEPWLHFLGVLLSSLSARRRRTRIIFRHAQLEGQKRIAKGPKGPIETLKKSLHHCTSQSLSTDCVKDVRGGGGKK